MNTDFKTSLTFFLHQSDELNICDVDPEVIEKAGKLRFRKEKTSAAIISKSVACKRKLQ